jgi:hypothetical protein
VAQKASRGDTPNAGCSFTIPRRMIFAWQSLDAVRPAGRKRPSSKSIMSSTLPSVGENPDREYSYISRPARLRGNRLDRLRKCRVLGAPHAARGAFMISASLTRTKNSFIKHGRKTKERRRITLVNDREGLLMH